jgi:CBS domain-containing protein
MRFTVHVGEVMKTDVKKLDMSEPIEKAAKIMRDENIGSIVVTGEKNIKGIVTMTDIVYKYVAEGKGKTVGDIMTRNPVTISPNRTIEEAAKLMVEKGIEKLLVFHKNKLVGIITNNDILKVEPALFEILLERLRIGPPIRKRVRRLAFSQCESCGNYSDTVKEEGGRFLCNECR